MIDIDQSLLKAYEEMPQWVVKKKRVLLLYMAYPFAIASYFRHALEKRPDVELVTCGAYTGDTIPWNGGMRMPMKYVKTVDLPLPPQIINPSWEMVSGKLGKDFDLVLNIDAGFHLTSKPSVPYAVVLTDPHVLESWYAGVRPLADKVFNMQRFYMKDGDIHLPYACSPDHHYAMSGVEKIYDACLIGLHYEQRDRLVNALRGRGRNVHYSIGEVYDEYRLLNNQARVGLNWSSLMDINARTFESMAMGLPTVLNRLPHLEELGFEEGRHYLGFVDVEEAVERVAFLLDNPDQAKMIADVAYHHVHENHTYEKRVEQIFKEMSWTT